SSRMQLLPPLSTLFPSPTLFLSAVVAVLDDVVNATTRIAIVVVIGLPYVSIRIDSNLIVVSEVVSQNFQLSSIRIASHNHAADRSEEHTSELQSRENLVCRLLLE